MPSFRFPGPNHLLIAISDRVWIRLLLHKETSNKKYFL